MKRIFRSMLTIFASLGLIMQLGVMTASAQTGTGTGLRISPVSEDIIVERGTSKSFDVIITNIADEAIGVRTFLNDFKSDGVTNAPQLIVDPNEVGENSAKDLILGVEDFNLDGNEVRTIPVNITVPEAQAPGSYFSAIRFQVAPLQVEEIPEGADFSLNTAVSFLVFVSVPGEATESGVFKNLGVANVVNPAAPDLLELETSNWFSAGTPNLVTIEIENNGEVFLEPFGQVTIKNMFGSEVAKYDLNIAQDASRSKVLPNSSQTFGNSVDFGGFGRFTVQADIALNQGGALESQTTTFWVVPYWLLLIFIGLLVAAGFAVKSLYTRYM